MRPDLITFLAELKRRKVFRVAAVYGAAAFVALQVADLVFPRLGLPDWTVTLVVALGVVGLPVALALAWAFDATPDGVRRTEPASTHELAAILAQPRSRRWPAGIAALLGVALLAGGAWFTLAGAGSHGGAYDSIAVLPFANLSGDPADDYFGDGLAEELLNALSSIEGLKVAARTSAFAFRGSNTDVRTIGDTLRVATVLAGGVRKSSGRVRITTQLLDARTGFQLWSQTYDRDMADIIVVQEEIARSIALALELRLARTAGRPLVRARPANTQAYEAYLRGRFFWNRRTAESIQSAIGEFQSALDLDPDFALAWAGLADACLTLQWYMVEADWNALLEQGRAAAERALELEPGLAQAHIALALYHASRFRWDAAERQFQRGIALDPGYPTAHQWYGLTLASLGRFDEALEHARLAAELDPLSPVINRGYGMILTWADHYPEAIAVLDRTLALDPAYQGIWETYTQLYLLLGRWDDAARAAERRLRLRAGDPELGRSIVRAVEAYAKTGTPAVVPVGFDALDELPSSRARLLSMMGATDAAIGLLQEQMSRGNPYLREISVDPGFRPLHADPRFLALLGQMNLRPVRPRPSAPQEQT